LALTLDNFFEENLDRWQTRLSKYLTMNDGVGIYRVGEYVIQDMSLKDFRLRYKLSGRQLRSEREYFWVHLGKTLPEWPDMALSECSKSRNLLDREKDYRKFWRFYPLVVMDEFQRSRKKWIILTCTHEKDRWICYRSELSAAIFVTLGGSSNEKLEEEVISIFKEINSPSFWWTIKENDDNPVEYFEVELHSWDNVGLYWSLTRTNFLAKGTEYKKKAWLVMNNKNKQYELFGDRSIIDDLYYFVTVGELHKSTWVGKPYWSKMLGWDVKK